MFSALGRLYLKYQPAEALERLYFSISMRQFAVSMIAIFEPIYLYRVFGTVVPVLFFYTAVYGIYFFTIPLGAKIAARRGAERSIAGSMFFVILYYLALYGVADHLALIYFAGFFFVADRTLLRVAYHTDIAQSGARHHRGREVGLMSFLETAAGTMGPVLGGFVLALFGFKVLFILVAAIALVSILPMVNVRQSGVRGDFSIWKGFMDFIRPQGSLKRRDSLAFMGYGEEIVSAVLWPVFVFMALPDYHIIGLVSTGALLLVAASRLYVGKAADVCGRKEKRAWVSATAAAYSLVQLLRYLAGSIWGVFAVNFASDTLKSGIAYPYFAYVYSAGGKNDDFLRYAVFYEMSLVAGRALLGLVLLLLSGYFVGAAFWFIIFIFAALWSWLYTLLKF